MHVWIFVFSTMFSPVVEPLGLSLDSAAQADPMTVAEVVADPSPETPMRYYGIERMLADLEAEAAAEGVLAD